MDITIRFAEPKASDGLLAHDLIANCPPLDPNSLYCNLLQADHFSQTSVAAFHEQQLIGFISGYLKPKQPDCLFVWQVAVSEQARGQGLAGRMLAEILARPACTTVRWLETTITADNPGSQQLFKSLAKRLNAPIQCLSGYDREQHFGGRHASEDLYRIGPF